ncbi:hypothetical protein [Streptomyces sp. NPDC048002]|uniref:hypothetical protein n=1 Tax=Streptomyces sp. NPDC048002 TaxID=3154344 RepID=UPI0033D489AE
MIYRHHIAPSRDFGQYAHAIIRHPRLDSHAVRLLTWQLSLPEGKRETLSETAARARIGATAFINAKRALKREGYLHEWRLQGPGGLWRTEQLITSEPLSDAEAAKLRGQRPPLPVSAASPQVTPSPRVPTVGQPSRRPTDGHPKANTTENTPDQPPEPPEPSTGEVDEEARALVSEYPRLAPALRHIPAAMRKQLTALTARWLAAGHTPSTVRAHILRGLPDDGTPVHRPGGLLRYLLREVAPVPGDTVPPPGATSSPGRLSVRLSGLRECEGEHTQATLFRPVGDETFCGGCSEGADRGAPESRKPGTPRGSGVPGLRC